MATSSGVFLATIYNQSQLAERKHVARYRSINTAATAVPLSMHPSPLVITTKLAAAILGGGCSEDVFCRPSTASVAESVMAVQCSCHCGNQQCSPTERTNSCHWQQVNNEINIHCCIVCQFCDNTWHASITILCLCHH